MAKATGTRGGRISKQDLKHDALVETAVKVEGYYHQHKNTVIGAAVGVIALIVVVLGARSWMAGSAGEGQLEMTTAKSNYGMSRLEDARAGFESILTTSGGERAAEAQYYLGRIKFDQRDYSGAQAAFEAVLKEHSPNESTALGAESGMAACLEALGRDNDAAENFMTLAGKYSGAPFAAEALTQAARLYLKNNQTDKAISALQRLVSEYPESQGATKAKTQLDQLR
ncbi:tetratricopeptide repeat protein [bacterium]|nr:tetratricopeptide repeat protein [bacterium]